LPFRFLKVYNITDMKLLQRGKDEKLMEFLSGTHDLRLPEWGPYTKKYIGVSHITDREKGIRFDLSVFPGFYRKKVDVPNVMWESGYHPWEAAANLSYYCHRHELEWKDRVYTDISYSEINENARLVRCECVNNTETNQNIVLHWMAYLNFPTLRSNSSDKIYPGTVELPANTIWIDGLDYEDMSYAVPRPTDNLVPDGFFRGEIRDNGFVNGSGLGKGFGKEKGDRAVYKFHMRKPVEDAALLLRYRVSNSRTAAFSLDGVFKGRIEFDGTGELTSDRLPIGRLEEGEHRLQLVSVGEESIEIDGFAVGPSDEVENVKFYTLKWDAHPDISAGPGEKSVILKYRDSDTYYGLGWEFDSFQIREFHCDQLDTFMRYTVHNHTRSVLKGEGDGHFTNVFMRPVTIEPHSKRVIYGIVCKSGSIDEVNEQIKAFDSDYCKMKAVYLSRRKNAVSFSTFPEGQAYAFSQQKMAATTLTNVVFPVYAKRSYIRHNTPGRWWDSLYTWDSGFIGLGLLEADISRAVDCLNAYMTEPGDTHAAFIHHGSPVPVQIYLYHELWNRTQSRELLGYFYPRLRQYYRFLAGKYGSSTTARLKSGLIKTWDYFYNSGGWDDYPPQVHVHKNNLEKYAAPVSNTSHCIRTAKILYMAAQKLGIVKDMEEYSRDIQFFAEAVQKHSWDEEAGYFGYVCHDDDGNPTGILRHESGKNYNMGLDGAYPLVAGICSDKQEKILVDYLTNTERMWTEIGISTVDKSAPYFRTDGYWNGAVWMPHQWFFWKTMLDTGQPEIAFKIAKTGLDVWKKEVDDSYNCFEHFIVQSGRGAGWHHFGGLSTPVLSWFGAYYKPGTFTCGFDVWIEEQHFSEDNSMFSANFKLNCCSRSACSVIVSLDPDYTYKVFLDGREAGFRKFTGGALSIDIPGGLPHVKLDVKREV